MATLTADLPTALITADGNSYISTPNGPLWICACGNDADRTHTHFDMAKEKYVTAHVCGDCGQNLP